MVFQSLQDELDILREQKLHRSLFEVEGPQGRWIRHQGRDYLNFCSNNYLGLAEDPQIIRAACAGTEKFGAGAGASRLVNGSLSPHHQLEEALAEFKGSEAALLFNSGYLANLGVLSCLVGEGDAIFSDELNHASMIDGIRLSGAKKIIYPHLQIDKLREKIREAKTNSSSGARLVIATESVFSMDGDVAPLGELLDLAQQEAAWLYVDEAHATGVFGERGAGLTEALRSHPAFATHLIQMGTLGKALGCFGAYVAGSEELRDFLVNRARTLIYSTALPPGICTAALQALENVRDDSPRREKLWDLLKYFSKTWEEFFAARPLQVTSPIIPVIVGASETALALSGHLKERGYWVTAIRPPTVPAAHARLRITLMATHTREDIRGLIAAIRSGLED